jgi:hypothetical protein
MPESPLQIIDATLPSGERKILGPYGAAFGVAEKIADGLRVAGASVDVFPLTLDENWIAGGEFSIAGSGMWPPRGFRLEDVASIYVDPQDRYVVSFVDGRNHDADDEITSPRDAARAAIGYLTECGGRVFVTDRATSALHTFEGSDLGEDLPCGSAPTINAAALDDAELARLQADGWAKIRAIKAQMRPVVVEQLARVVRRAIPDAARLRLSVVWSEDSEASFEIGMVEDAAGETIDHQVLYELPHDTALATLLPVLCDIDGIEVERVTLNIAPTDDQPALADQRPAKIARTTYTFTVLHPADQDLEDLDDALREATDGHAVGAVIDQRTSPVSNAQVPSALLELGNDGAFFDEDLADDDTAQS